jgi:hypothetical protein
MDDNQSPDADLSNFKIESGSNRNGVSIKELIRMNIASETLKYVIFGTGIIIGIILAIDVILVFNKTAGQAPDIVDHVVRIGGLTIPLISFILGHIFGKSQD